MTRHRVAGSLVAFLLVTFVGVTGAGRAAALDAPANDNFANAVTISGPSGSIVGTNVGATTETGEPAIPGYGGGGPYATVWYNWTAPGSGPVIFDTCTDTNLDTLLGVYTGSAYTGPDPLARVADGDDNCGPGGVQSRASFIANVGVTYRIQVDGWHSHQDQFTLSWSLTPTTPTITWTDPAPITYGTALDATQLNATASVAGTFAYTPPAGTVLNVGASQILSVIFTPTDTTSYTTATATVHLTVGQATPSITWTDPAPITYGTALDATRLNATASVAGTFAYTPAAGTALGLGASQVLSVTFTPTDTTNYTTATATVHLTVGQATPVITWADPAAITYGTALGATQLNATASVPGSFVYAPLAGTMLNAGASQALSVTFTPTDTVDYTAASKTVHITVGQATPVITWADPAPITYGTPLDATRLNATASVAGTFAYTPAAGTVLGLGASQALSVTFTPTDAVDYTSATKTVHITVGQATPVITWADPAAITYGTALGATQLNATASVPGSFVYAPLAGTMLNVGASQALSVTFTPTDAVDYTSATKTVHITVAAAPTPDPAVSAPVATLVSGGTTAGTSIPVTVSWSATDIGSGITSYTLERSSDGGAHWYPVPLASPTAASAVVNLVAGSAHYQFHVWATDAAGRTSPTATGSVFTLSLTQESAKTVKYAKTWKKVTSKAASGGTLRTTVVKNATATFTVSGRSFAIVAAVGKKDGKALVYDGKKLIAAIDLKAAKTAYQKVVLVGSWTSSGKHVIRIVCAATRGRPTIDLDAFVVMN
jgi:hypothetical protein